MIHRLFEVVVEDFWLKLFSLALAILIWFTIFQAIQQQGSPVTASSANLQERTLFNLPVIAISSSSDVRGFKVSPDEIQVTVQGDAKSVESLQTDEIKAWVELSGTEAGAGIRKPVEVSTPLGLTCVKIEPAEVQVISPPKRSAPPN